MQPVDLANMEEREEEEEVKGEEGEQLRRSCTGDAVAALWNQDCMEAFVIEDVDGAAKGNTNDGGVRV